MISRFLLLPLLMVFSATAFAADPNVLAVLGNGLKGFLEELPSPENAPPKFQELSLTPDGENFRLTVAGWSTISVPADKMEHHQIRHPGGPWIMTLIRVQLNALRIDFVFRTDEALAFDAKNSFGGHFETLPRVLYTIKDMRSGENLARGMAVAGDQPGVLESTLATLTQSGATFVSFAEEQNESCANLMKKSLIRTRQ
jgi:hypothetical protein